MDSAESESESESESVESEFVSVAIRSAKQLSTRSGVQRIFSI